LRNSDFRGEDADDAVAETSLCQENIIRDNKAGENFHSMRERLSI
jgi:hypothetical protein